MGRVTFHITVSLDGFVAGPNDGPANGLGDGGDALFQWYFSGNTPVSISSGTPPLKVSPESALVLKEMIAMQGAEVCGRRTFDIARGWGGHPPFSPCFVVTHTVPPEWAKPASPFVFVTDGVASAIRQAKQAAGDKDVVVATASILQQALDAGLMDEIHVSVAPLLLGGGVRLFDHLHLAPIELECMRVVQAPGVTHMGYRIAKRSSVAPTG